MTFKGIEYQTILDMERCLFVAQADEKVLELQLKTYRLQREKLLIEETETKLNIQRNFICELETLIEEMTDKIDRISEDMGDMESLIFTSKFVKGLSNQEIMNKMHIAEPTLFKYFDKINKKLETTEAVELKNALTE